MAAAEIAREVPALPPLLEVRLLGAFAVAIDGAEVAATHWTALRASHLVQLLCLQPRHRATRDLIVDALWPQLDPEAGAANLRKAVYHVRQTLRRHDAVVGQGNEWVLWPAGQVVVDADAFEQAALQALQDGNPSACADAAQRYADLLPGARYEAWTEPARERLQALCAALWRAAARWERLARLDPTDEEAHRELMAQALAVGQRASALHWYARLREALQQELGITPDAQTQALYERCVAGLPAAGPAFIGRALELARIAGWLQLPALERPGGIVLCGPPGIGKSALCREAVLQARSQGWASVRVHALPDGPSHGLVAALAQRLIVDDPQRLDCIGTAARSVLAQLVPQAGLAPALPGPLGRHQVVGAIRRLLLAAAEQAPLLLLADDVHLAAEADVEVLMQLVAAGPPLCLLLTMRPVSEDTPLARGIARLQRAGTLQRLDVEALGADESTRLVASTLSAPVEDRVVAQIVLAAQGNPFAAIELAHGAGPGALGPLPGNTADAIARRLCDVSASQRAYLSWLALCGEDVALAVLEPLAVVAQSPAFPALDAALAAGVLVVVEGHYRFRHALVRQALVEQITPHQRRRMHRALAVLLSDLAVAPATVARHWLAAGQPHEAAPWLLAGAREAMRLAAFADALQLLAPLLAHAAAHPEALRLRAEALDAQGDPAALCAYRVAASVASAADSHDLRAKAALAQVKLGDPKGALLALQGVSPVSVEGRLCEALAWSGAAALGVADPAVGTAKSAVARRLALASGDTAALVIASWAQAAAAHARGELHRSVWADLHETRHAPQLAVRVFDGHLCITQRFLYGARPYPEVIAFADAIAGEARRLGAARGHAFGTTLRGEAELLAGDLAAAQQHLREGARLHRAISGPVGEALSVQRLAEVALLQGRPEEARALLDEALDLARQTDIGFHLLDRIYGTRIMLHADDPAAALSALEEASASVRGPLETCPGCRITFAVPAAIAAARAGQVALAEHHAAQSAYLAQVVMRLPAWHAAHAEVLGHIERARQADATAALHFQAAANGFRQAGQPLDAARCDRLARHAH